MLGLCFSNFFWAGGNTPTLVRLYVIALCTWYITYFALKNIERDWKENLVLRRVYYLEADHYGNRQAELDETVYRREAEGDGGAGWSRSRRTITVNSGYIERFVGQGESASGR